MAIKAEKHKLVFVGAAAILALALGGCSSKKQQEETPAEGTAEAAEAADATDPVESEVVAAAAGESTPAATLASPSTTSNGAVIMYVKAKSCGVLDAPSGKEVGKLSRGEHVLVWIDGEWAKTSDGRFVSAKHLSDKGIARERNPSVWNAGVAH